MPKQKPPKNYAKKRQPTASTEGSRKSRRLREKETASDSNDGGAKDSRFKTEEEILAELAKREAEEAQKLLPSPNKQTRTRRKESNITCEKNSVERKQIAQIVLDFMDEDHVPCSVYGRDREERYPGYTFCSRCKKADDESGFRPSHKINRKAIGGRYTCRSKHTNFWHPTYIDPKKKNSPKPPPIDLFCRPCNGDKSLRTTRKRKKRQRRKRSRIKPPPPSSTLESILYQHPQGKDETKNPTQGNVPQDDNDLISEIDEDKYNDAANKKETPQFLFNLPLFQDPLSHYSFYAHDSRDHAVDETESFDVDNEELDDLPPFENAESQQSRDEQGDSSTTEETRNRTYLSSNETLDNADESANMDSTQEDNEEITRLHNQIHCLEQDLLQAHQAVSDYRKSLKKVTDDLTDCRRKLKNRSDDLRYWRDKDAETKATSKEIDLPASCYDIKDREKLVSHIREILVSRTSRMDDTSRAAGEFFRDVAQLCLDKSIHNGLMFENTYGVFRKYVRDYVFTPFNILRKMDLAGGVLNLGGIEVLRQVESNGVANTHTLIPSSSCIQDVAKEVEKFGSLLCPYRLFRHKTDGSEGFAFRAADVMAGILVAGNCLYGDARWRPIQLAQSLDGALFTKNLSHTLGGLKFNDMSNPLAQSRNSCFPVVCVCRPESKGLVRSIFRNMIEEIREAAVKVLPTKFGVWPLKICTNCDMSCEWKLLGRGGAAQQVNFPCSKCTVRSGELHLPTGRVEDCSLCSQLGHSKKTNWVCRHHKMCTRAHVNSLQKEVDHFVKEMPSIYESLTDIWGDSELIMQEDPRMDPTKVQKGNIKSIHFDLGKADVAKRLEYARFITNDLVVRELDVHGTLEQRQRRLKAHHVKEWIYYQAKKVLDDYKQSKTATAIVYMMDTVPCILHMENRMGIKILTMCLRHGLASAKVKEFDWMPEEYDNSEIKRCNHFIKRVQKCMNQSILGTSDMPTQWKAPYEKKKRKLGTITMDNVRIRRMLPKFDELVDICIANPEKQVKWKQCVADYVISMERLNKKTNMTDSEIFDYQRKADEFFATWVDLCGENGITNYAHLIGSGHVMEYLIHWRNLSSHAQQGWEGE